MYNASIIDYRAHRAVYIFIAALLFGICFAPLGVRAAPRIQAGPQDGLVHVTLTLAPRDSAGLNSFLRAQKTKGSGDFRRFLTPEQFVARFSPTKARVRALTDWLASVGFTHIQVAPNRLSVSAAGTRAVVHYALGDAAPPTASASVQTSIGPENNLPRELRPLVSSVIRPSNNSHMRSFAIPRAKTAAAPNARPVTPKQIATAYQATSLPPASDAVVAVFVAGDMTPVLDDLAQAQSHFHMPAVAVEEVKAGSPGTPYDSKAETTEWDLDTQAVLAMGRTFKKVILYNTGTLTNSDILHAITRWVTEDRAPYANASFGECEGLAKSSGFIAALEPVLKQAVAQGQTLFAASGDNHGMSQLDCPAVSLLGIDIGSQNMTYPASSPYVVSVGATTLHVDSAGQYVTETTWSGSIGGISAFFGLPIWQQGVTSVSSLLASVLGSDSKPEARGVPDIAMNGNPSSGMVTIVNGQPVAIGGTSLSSPLAMAAWARAEQASGTRAGFAAPALYDLYKLWDGKICFNDVTSGSADNYPASRGWDHATGAGSMQVAAMAQTLSDQAKSENPQKPGNTGTGKLPATSASTGTDNTSSNSKSGGGAFGIGLVLLGLVGITRRRCRK